VQDDLVVLELMPLESVCNVCDGGLGNLLAPENQSTREAAPDLLRHCFKPLGSALPGGAKKKLRPTARATKKT